MKLLREASKETLEQVILLINCCSDQEYCQLFPHAQSSVGMHVRHILDHFIAFKNGLDSDLINYNIRNRESQIECDRGVGLAQVKGYYTWFCDQDFDDKSVFIESEISISATQNEIIESRLSRELVYLINHTIHHVAYAGLGAKQLGIKIDSTLGVAPGTATHLRTQKSVAGQN